MKGIKEKETRSGLYYEGYRILKEKRPEYSIIENVKNLTSKRFKNEFEKILKDIEDLGYNNYWNVLNAKDFGIPQNRERVFIVSIRKDIDDKKFSFPKKIPLKIFLKDLLENGVDEKYYLSYKGINRIIYKDNRLVKNNFENPKVSSCIIAGYYKTDGKLNQYLSEKNKILKKKVNNQPFILIKDGTKKGYKEANIGDAINLSYLNNMKRRGRVGKGISQTILTSTQIAVLEKAEKSNAKSSAAILISEDSKTFLRIRKLTPLECWRLMGFDDVDFYKAKLIGTSDTQLYKQAGNSIVVDVLEYIFRDLLYNELKEDSFDKSKKIA